MGELEDAMSDTSGTAEGAEVAADTGSSTTSEPATTNEAAAPTVEQLQAELDQLKADARKWENRAKTNDEKLKGALAGAQELEKLKRAQMSEHEQQVAAAKAAGATEARKALSAQLVAMALRASAAGRLDDQVLDRLSATINAELFVAEDGTVNVDEVQSLVDGLVPKPPPAEAKPPDARFPEIGGQGNQGAPPLNDNALLSALKAAVGSQ